MRIHTDTISYEDLHSAVRSIPGGDVTLHTYSRHGSRSRDHAYEIQLRGQGERHTRRPNTGTNGADSSERAATYDDWGWFLAWLFRADPRLTCTYYSSEQVFRELTDGRFVLAEVTR